MKRVFVIAGESSGDLHGSALMRSMKTLRDDLSFKGIGGALMEAEGLDAIRSVQQMSIMGFAEVLKHLPFIRRTMNDCIALLDSWKPDVVILIDYPGFNLRFAPHVKRRGIPLMYYISPQLWAWHTSRVSLIRKYVDRMVVLFDFEKRFYRRYGIEADFVGHPLLDTVQPTEERDSFRTRLGAEGNIPLIGFLPGSRVQEIDRILPAMAGSVALLRQKIGAFVPVLGCAPGIEAGVYDRCISGAGIVKLSGLTYDIMAHADAVAVTSGTATLEAGISGAPMVIVYRTSLVTWLMGRALVDIDNIGLINIVAGGRIVPELWQNDVTPENISMLLARLVTENGLRNVVKERLASAKQRLGGTGASGRTAAIAVDLLDNRNYM